MAVTLRIVLDEAESSLFADLPRAALALCRLALGAYPRCLRAHTVIAATLWALGDIDNAARTVRGVLQADPESLPARYLLALALEERDLDGAIAQLEIALSLAPSDGEVRQGLRRLYRQRDRAGREVRPGRDALARTYARGGLWDRAHAEAADLLVAHPARLDLKLLLVEAEWRTGHADEAAVLCQDILLSQPFCLKANLILGSIRQLEGQLDQALSLFDRAGELDPEHRMARHLFGATLDRLPYQATEALVRVEAEEEPAPPEGAVPPAESDLQQPLPLEPAAIVEGAAADEGDKSSQAPDRADGERGEDDPPGPAA